MKNILRTSAILAIVVGIIMVFGGAWAVMFTYQNVAKENIVTPEDASIPNTPVRGPFTLHSQAEVIRKHILERTGGQSYAEMSRDDTRRDMWITATTLTTALHLGIITYLFSGLIILFGLVSLWTGFVFWGLSKKY